MRTPESGLMNDANQFNTSSAPEGCSFVNLTSFMSLKHCNTTVHIIVEKCGLKEISEGHLVQPSAQL